jgi:hypothetical protein
MTKAGLLATAMLGATVAGGGPAATRPARPRAGGDGPIVYWMSAETATFAPWPNSPPDAATEVRRLLRLDLGSPRRPDERPAAEHLVPPGLGLGPAIRLVTLARMPPTPIPAPPPLRILPGDRPARPGAGQVHIYWGCGEHVRRGQPLIMTEADALRRHAPPAVATRPFTPMTPPNDQSAATFGQYYSLNSRARLPANASLVGAHGLRGNYVPEIRFSLVPGQDFLAPIELTANRAGASGAVALRWRPVARARAYFVTASIKWFEDGVLNVAYNCIDRHLTSAATRPRSSGKATIPKDDKHITYRELHDEVCRLANILRKAATSRRATASPSTCR